MMKKTAIILLCLFVTNVWAGVAANRGDIRVFISPQAIAPIKVRLLLRTNNQPTVIANETPLLMPAQYYTFSTTALKNYAINNQTVYIQLYNSVKKQWVPPILLIKNYDSTTSPFYQFSCWFEGSSLQPLCGGEEQT